MKKIFAILLAAIMMLSMTAMAASITITPPTVDTSDPDNSASETGITYTAYKIFDATISGDNIAYTIKTSSPYYSTIQAASNYFTLTASAGDNTTMVVTLVEKKNAAGESFDPKQYVFDTDAANTLSDTLKTVNVPDTNTEYCVGTLEKQTDGSYKLDNLADGYYLVTSSVGTDLILDTIGDITVTTKNSYPTITKKVEGQTSTTADHDEVLTFTISVSIPATASGEIVVHDDMTNLEYKSMTTVEGITAASTDLTDGCEAHFTLSADYVAANKGTTITIEYTAKFTGEENAQNDAWLTDDTYTSKKETTKVYTTDVQIEKYVDDDIDNSFTGDALSGAKFVLKNSAGKFYKVSVAADATDESPAVEGGTVTWVDTQADATVVTTGADGKAEFENIADGTYYLVETEAPTGYNLLTAPVTVTVNHMTTSETTGEDGQTTSTTAPTVDVTAKVENSTGSELPSTGGIGTTIFYVVGGLMMAAAVVLLVSKRKVAASK